MSQNTQKLDALWCSGSELRCSSYDLDAELSQENENMCKFLINKIRRGLIKGFSVLLSLINVFYLGF